MKVLLLTYQDEKAMQRLPRVVGNHGLRPTGEAKTVRKQAVLDGPFAEDAALAWAKRHPAAPYGAVEVRPVWT